MHVSFLRTSFHNKVLYGRLIRATGAGRAIARADSLAVVSDLDALGDGAERAERGVWH